MGKEKTGRVTKEEALGKAMALCGGSEHCTFQIEEKLFSWGVSADDAEEIICRLVDEKFVDNMRFARAYCHDKFRFSHWGRVKIRQMLRHLRLSDGEIAEGLAVIPDEDYMETLNEVLGAKNRTLKDTDNYVRKAKLVRHLLSRGFETELAVMAVDACLN